MSHSGILQPSTKTEYLMPDGTPSWATEILNSFKGDDQGPHSYLAEQYPNYTLRAHFHFASQFQIVVRGHGHLGQHRLEPVVVHYTERQNGYGPIIADGDGLAYMVLRPVKDVPKAFFLPESIKEIDRSVIRRQVTSEIIPPSTEKELAARTEVRTELAIAPNANGLASWFVRLGPNMRNAVQSQYDGQGRFHVVITGSALADGEALPPMGSTWVPPGESLELQAGPGGADILVMQFPRDSWKPNDA